MEKGISRKGSTSTINSITLHNLQPIKRRCSPGCGKMFETTVGGPRICSECRERIKKLKTSPQKNRAFSLSNRGRGVGVI